jgi:hypothetical protein
VNVGQPTELLTELHETMLVRKKKAPEIASGAQENLDASSKLNAEGASATASALHVGIVEFETGTFHGFDIVDFNAVQVHGTHLVDGNLQAVELKNLIGIVGLIFKRHVILEPRAATAYDGNAQRSR